MSLYRDSSEKHKIVSKKIQLLYLDMFMWSKWLGTFFLNKPTVIEAHLSRTLFKLRASVKQSRSQQSIWYKDRVLILWSQGMQLCTIIIIMSVYCYLTIFCVGECEITCLCLQNDFKHFMRKKKNTTLKSICHDSNMNYKVDARERFNYSPTECIHLCASLIQTQATFNLLCEDYQLFKTYFVCFNNVCLTLVSVEPDLHGVL